MNSQLNWPGRRDHLDAVHGFVSPWRELNAGLWSLFIGATLFLGLRIWCKITRRFGLWYDDYILVVSWLILFANNILIVWQFGNGYVLKDSTQKWDDRMRILINISSSGTLIGQAWTKTAFGVTLLRIVKNSRWQRAVLWFCIGSMNIFMFLKVLFQWARICDKSGYQQSWRIDFCIHWKFRQSFKEGGNVYNIIMDFVFATFPWVITRHLEMHRSEKIGLCVTMSLGMVVAIVSAIRVSWKDEGNTHDEYYFFRNGVSQVWYSSEVAGTIIVQCIPILRPILREFTTNSSSGEKHRSLTFQSGFSFNSKHTSFALPNDPVGVRGEGFERIALKELLEEDLFNHNYRRTHSSLTDNSNMHPESSGTSVDPEFSPSFMSFGADLEEQKGLRPTPGRFL